MFAEVIGELALTETEHLERTREFLDSEIPWLQCMLNLIPGIDIFPAEANYVMCTFDAGPDLALGVANTDELAQRLQLAGFLVRKLEGTPALEDSRYFLRCRAHARGQREAGGGPARDRRGVLGRSSP